MRHEIKKIENSAAELKFNLTAEELAPIKSQILKELVKKVEVPGFRKGNAPVDKVEAQYADLLKEEIVEKVLKENFDKVIADEKLSPISFIYNLKADMTKDGLELVFNIDLYPEVTLGQYKGLEAEKETFEMSETLLNDEIETLLQSKSKLVDAPEGTKAAMGDTVDLAFEGFIDGVPFEGGKADSHQLKLGSKMFIDTFEDQLVGYTVGQEGEIVVNFPENYHQASLAGKPATFKVKINAIKVLEKPELNDEFAKELGYDSVADLKAKKEEELKAREELRIKNDFTGKLIQKVVADSKVEIPKSMITREIEARFAEMDQQLAMQGMNLETYLKMTGMTMEKAFNQMAPMALNKVTVDLVLETIAKAENIALSEEELAEKISEVAKMYGMTTEQLETELNKNNNLENFKATLKGETLLQKAVEVIVNNAK
ncbi:MAG: trigger factor [Cetobacterium sp.]|uniref:trigger factor n=1 Tax=unclassified Cetobacterium TaxID=2630983 RepID=UPI00163C29FD|nr:trigger factor [Cetobacterium sp. 2A]MBC2856492.1 trigger factor [Cetobacterium sp. 2A]